MTIALRVFCVEDSEGDVLVLVRTLQRGGPAANDAPGGTSLRQAEDRYRTLVERIPAITYIAALDEANSMLYISPQIATILGIAQSEWMADPNQWRAHLHPQDLDRVLADIESAQTSSGPIAIE